MSEHIKKKEQDEIKNDTEEFLKNGGEIQKIPIHISSDYIDKPYDGRRNRQPSRARSNPSTS